MKKYFKYLVLIVSLFLLLGAGRSIVSFLGRGKTVEEAEQKLEKLKEEQARLLVLKEQVESEEFVEREAREKLGLAKPGETVVVLPDEEILRRLAPPVEEEDFIEELPIWRRWAKLFFLQ